MRKTRVKELRVKAFATYFSMSRSGKKLGTFKNFFRKVKRLYLAGEVY